MPGKVNPTQCEALTMIAVQVMANGAGIGFAASQGNFELNVFLPVLAHEFLQSARLLAEGMRSFRLRCADGIRANREKMAENLRRSLMLVTALSPTIGYEAAAETAKLAHREDPDAPRGMPAPWLPDRRAVRRSVPSRRDGLKHNNAPATPKAWQGHFVFQCRWS